MQAQKLTWSKTQAAGKHHHCLQAEICDLKQALELLRCQHLFFAHAAPNPTNFNGQHWISLKLNKLALHGKFKQAMHLGLDVPPQENNGATKAGILPN
ncbi:MAG TPA: hypothetical protein VFI72_11020 [Candidatus Angelobacter sp.]|nr:hypothetical protein [Candidatus Angelobacter sp.]